LFEERGGFGRVFEKFRFGPESREISNYPCNSGIFGAGCNMAFCRRALLDLGKFDEALDTGPPLPGGGDLDIFYRVVSSGLVLVSEPGLLVWHQHRREYRQLRQQMYTWGLGMMAYATKHESPDLGTSVHFHCMILGWFRSAIKNTIRSANRRCHWTIGLALAELWGGLVGVYGEYHRSQRRIRRIHENYKKNAAGTASAG